MSRSAIAAGSAASAGKSGPPLPAPVAATIRGAGRRLLGSRRGRGFVILIYHRVLEAPDPLRPGEITASEFAVQMSALAQCFNVLPLPEAIERQAAGTLPPMAAAITFDDGYRDNLERALPVLQQHDLPATVFITTGTLDRCMWNDVAIELLRQAPPQGFDSGALDLGTLPTGNITERRASLFRVLAQLKSLPWTQRDDALEALLQTHDVEPPEGLMLDAEGVRELHRAGVEIGAHTVHHPILSRIPLLEAEAEVAGSRTALEDITGSTVTLFAYPNGRPGVDYTGEHADLVRRLGFRAAVSTERGANRPGHDRFELRRFTPWDRTPLRFVGRLLLSALRD